MSGGEESPPREDIASPEVLATGSDLDTQDRHNVEALRSLMGNNSSVMNSPSLFTWDVLGARERSKRKPSGPINQDTKRVNGLSTPSPVKASHDIKLTMNASIGELDKALERVNLRDKSPFNTEHYQPSSEDGPLSSDSTNFFGTLKTLRIKAMRHHLTALDLERYLDHGKTPKSLQVSVSCWEDSDPILTKTWEEAHKTFRRTLTKALLESNKRTVSELADKIESATKALHESQSETDFLDSQSRIERAEAVEVKRLIERKNLLFSRADTFAKDETYLPDPPARKSLERGTKQVFLESRAARQDQNSGPPNRKRKRQSPRSRDTSPRDQHRRRGPKPGRSNPQRRAPRPDRRDPQRRHPSHPPQNDRRGQRGQGHRNQILRRHINGRKIGKTNTDLLRDLIKVLKEH